MSTTYHHLEQQKARNKLPYKQTTVVIVLFSPVVAQFGAEPKTTIWGTESRRWRRKALVLRKGPGSLHWRAGASAITATASTHSFCSATHIWAPPHPLLSGVNN